jgi:hypothetical protein
MWWKAFARSLLVDASGKYGEINWYRIFRTILLTCYLGCNLRWQCFVPLWCNAFQKLMWCTCLWRHDAYAHVVWCLWCMSAWLGYPQNELVIERTITGREGVCVASRILTTMIPSAHLVAIMWMQRTWRPRLCRGTFSYGITTSPNIKDRVGDIETLHAYAR